MNMIDALKEVKYNNKKAHPIGWGQNMWICYSKEFDRFRYCVIMGKQVSVFGWFELPADTFDKEWELL